MRVLVHFSKLPLDKGSYFHIYSDAPGSTTFLVGSDSLLAGFMLEADDLTTKITVDSLIPGVGSIIEMPILGGFSDQQALDFIEAQNIPVFLEEDDGEAKPIENGTLDNLSIFDTIKSAEPEEHFAIEILGTSFELVRLSLPSTGEIIVHGVGSDYTKTETSEYIDYQSDLFFVYTEDQPSGDNTLIITDNVNDTETFCYQSPGSTEIKFEKINLSQQWS